MIDLYIHTNYSGGENDLIEILKIAEKCSNRINWI